MFSNRVAKVIRRPLMPMSLLAIAVVFATGAVQPSTSATYYCFKVKDICGGHACGVVPVEDGKGEAFWPPVFFSGPACSLVGCPNTICSTGMGTDPAESEARFLAIRSEIGKAIEASDVDALLDIVSNAPEVSFNQERRAVQVAGCSEDVIVAHFPLSRQMWIAVSTHGVLPELASR